MHEQTLAFYRLLRELREAHPGLEIESCSSGGGRVDLGVLELTDRVWVSDNSDPHDRQSMMRWTAQLVPPEYLGAHIASDRSHTTGRRLDLSFRASTAIFGHLGIEWDLGEATDAELALLVALDRVPQGASRAPARRRRRADGRARPADQRARRGRADGSEAIFSAAVLDTTHPDPPARLKLRGLDPARTYRVTPVFIGTLPVGA